MSRPIPPNEMDEQSKAQLYGLLNHLCRFHEENDRLSKTKEISGLQRAFHPRPEVRHPRTILVEGDRGVGKTTAMVTLIDRWYAVQDHERPGDLRSGAEPPIRSMSDDDVLKRCVFLPGRDFDPFPRGMGPYPWLLLAFEPLVKALARSGRAQDDHAAYRGSSGRASSRTLTEQFDDLFHRALIGASARDLQKFESVEEMARSEAKQNRDWMALADDFRDLVDRLGALSRSENTASPTPLFVVTVDDVDFRLENLHEFLQALRHLYHPNVAFVVAAHEKQLQGALEFEMLQRLKAPASDERPWMTNFPEKLIEKTLPRDLWVTVPLRTLDEIWNLVLVPGLESLAASGLSGSEARKLGRRGRRTMRQWVQWRGGLGNLRSTGTPVEKTYLQSWDVRREGARWQLWWPGELGGALEPADEADILLRPDLALSVDPYPHGFYLLPANPLGIAVSQLRVGWPHPSPPGDLNALFTLQERLVNTDVAPSAWIDAWPGPPDNASATLNPWSLSWAFMLSAWCGLAHEIRAKLWEQSGLRAADLGNLVAGVAAELARHVWTEESGSLQYSSQRQISGPVGTQDPRLTAIPELHDLDWGLLEMQYWSARFGPEWWLVVPLRGGRLQGWDGPFNRLGASGSLPLGSAFFAYWGASSTYLVPTMLTEAVSESVLQEPGPGRARQILDAVFLTGELAKQPTGFWLVYMTRLLDETNRAPMATLGLRVHASSRSGLALGQHELDAAGAARFQSDGDEVQVGTLTITASGTWYPTDGTSDVSTLYSLWRLFLVSWLYADRDAATINAVSEPWHVELPESCEFVRGASGASGSIRPWPVPPFATWIQTELFRAGLAWAATAMSGRGGNPRRLAAWFLHQYLDMVGKLYALPTRFERWAGGEPEGDHLEAARHRFPGFQNPPNNYIHERDVPPEVRERYVQQWALWYRDMKVIVDEFPVP